MINKLSLNERGNTWLMQEDNHVAWFTLENGQRLEVSVTPGNYPGFLVTILPPEMSTDEHLTKHIHDKCDGWTVCRCNIHGVRVVTGIVSAPDTH